MKPVSTVNANAAQTPLATKAIGAVIINARRFSQTWHIAVAVGSPASLKKPVLRDPVDAGQLISIVVRERPVVATNVLT